MYAHILTSEGSSTLSCILGVCDLNFKGKKCKKKCKRQDHTRTSAVYQSE